MDINASNVFAAKAVVIIYEKPPDGYDRSGGDIYMEAARVKENVTGPFAPLSKRVVNLFGVTLLQSSVQRVSGVIPPNLMYASFDEIHPHLIWYTEPMTRMMYYDPVLGILSGHCQLPWLVWRVYSQKLYLYASKGKPDLNSKLYKAPFHNTDAQGVVCLGTGYQKLSKTFESFTNTIENVETAFFDTKFNTLQDSHRITGNINQLYQKLIETGMPFDPGVLIDTKHTITSLITPKSHGKRRAQPQGDQEDQDDEGDWTEGEDT